MTDEVNEPAGAVRLQRPVGPLREFAAGERVAGHFGSAAGNVLVLKVPDCATWYAVDVPWEDIRWRMYCEDAALFAPENPGEMTRVEFRGQAFELRCWPVSRQNVVNEVMALAYPGFQRPNCKFQPPRPRGDPQ